MKSKIKKNGYEYEEICSNEAGKLFVQKLHGEFVAYEVVKRKPVSSKQKLRFRFPGNEAFGYSAWCFKQLNQAMEKLIQLKEYFRKKQYS